MLRNPLSPSTTLPSFLASARTTAMHPRLRIAAAFFLLGLLNNVLYVIILSAALDLVGPSVPKGLVLLFDVTPALVLKLCLPFFIHRLKWSTRVWCCALLATSGMVLIALSPSAIHDPRSSSGSATATSAVAGRLKALLGRPKPLPDARPTALELALKMTGIALASLASGGGESSFVALTSSYDGGRASLAAWGSGTGAAGLVGAGAYTLATTALGLSSRTALLAFAGLPLIMLVAYFIVLPPAESQAGKSGLGYTQASDRDEDERRALVDHDDDGHHERGVDAYASRRKEGAGFAANLGRARGLVVPYMLPLFLVYFSEYTINQGVSPTLLFPLDETPFKHYRDFYPTYGTMYQLGVFISRSSLPFVRIQALYLPSLLQWLNLGLFVAQAMTFHLMPNVFVVFAVIFYEGLLGGLVYISAFRRIGEEVPPDDREFSLAAATVSDSAGICLASFLSMAVETGLCRWQVSHGRDWCRRL